MSRTSKAGLVALALAGLVPGVAAAQTRAGWDLAPEVYYYSYREPNFIHQIGGFAGVNTSYTYKVGPAFITGNGIFDLGYLNYKSNGTGNLNGKVNAVGDFRVLAGADLMQNEWFGISPFTGLGYRMLYEWGGGRTTTTGAVGYDRFSQYFYIPAGLGFSFAAGGWFIRPSAEYDFLVRGQQTSYLSQVGAFGDIKNQQNHGYGLRGTLLFERGAVAFGPFVRYWDIGESKPAFFSQGGFEFVGIEPHNKTLEAGATFHFHF